MPVTLLRDPTSKLYKTFPPPYQGTWKTLPPYLLPDDALQGSNNICVREGALQARHGLRLFDTTSLGNRILGSYLATDTSNNKFACVATKTKFWVYNAGWLDQTGAITFTSTDDNPARMTGLQLGTTVYMFLANGSDPLYVADTSTFALATITPLAGSIPVLTDICTSFSRLIGITPPYTVQWCDIVNNSYLSYTNWPASNQAILSDTEDPVVAIRALGTLGVVVYKEGNIFVGFGQSGTNSNAFRFEHRGEYEGPAGPNAIVNVNGTHIYMTPTGRIGSYDGTHQQWLCDGIWSFLQKELDFAYPHRIFAVYDYQTAMVYFWYPRAGESGVCKGMVILNLPFPSAGIRTYAAFLGETAFECTNGLTVRPHKNLVPDENYTLVFGKNATHQTFKLRIEEYADNSVAFPCSCRYPLFRPQNDDGTFRAIYALYCSRDNTRGELTVTAVSSDMLEDTGKTGDSETINLSQLPINEYIGFNDTGSFVGLQLDWNSTARTEVKGIDVYARETT